MDSKKCEHCGETVDSARAFCPSCGNPLVPEATSERVSEFEATAGTVQFRLSLYNELLEDMGLNISEPPNKPELPTATVSLAETEAAGANQVAAPATSSGRKWIMIGVAALTFILAAAGLLLTIAIFLYFGLNRFAT